MTHVTGSPMTLNNFWSDLDENSVQKFVNEYCVMCGNEFTSNHDLSLFRKFPASILTGLDIEQIQTDF